MGDGSPARTGLTPKATVGCQGLVRFREPLVQHVPVEAHLRVFCFFEIRQREPRAELRVQRDTDAEEISGRGASAPGHGLRRRAEN